MKEITFLILLICNFIFSNAQTNYTVNETHNTKSYGLKGNPKQLIEKGYVCKKDNTKVLDYIQTQQFDINGNATFVKYFSKNNSYTQYTYYKYNKTNNPIEEIIIGPNGKMFYKELNIYNELGKIIEKIRYNNDSVRYLQYMYIYDSIGFLTKINSKFENRTIKEYGFEYDTINHTTLQITYNPNRKKYNKELFRYDNKDNLINWQYIHDTVLLTIIHNYKYDIYNNLIFEEYIRPENAENLSDENYNKFTKHECITYKYDSSNNLIMSNTTYPESGNKEKNRSIYKYYKIDKAHNWHLKNTLSNNGIYKTVREIEYY